MAITGYKYFFGIHMGISRGPVNELCEIRAGDRRVWLGSVNSNTTLNLDAGEIFGGSEREGGIEGPLEVMMGGPTQIASAGLATMLGGALPGFRGMFTVFFNGLIGSNNPYPKPWKFRLRRTTQGWDGDCPWPELATILIPAEEPVDLDPEPVPDEHVGVTPPTGWVQTDETDTYAAFFGHKRGWWRPPNTVTVNTSGEPPAGWVPALPTDWNALNFPNATVPGYYAPNSTIGGVVIDTSGYPPDDWVTTYPGDPNGLFFRFGLTYGPVIDWSTGGWYAPTISVGLPPPSDWISTTNADPYYVWFPAFGYYKPLDAGVAGVPAELAVIHAMNPAHIIFECLTNRAWGRGMSRSMIDMGSFERAAVRLFSEKFGLCMKWTRKDAISSFVQSVLDHIGAALFLSRKTGLMTLRLIRGDYDFNALPLYEKDRGLLEIRDASIASVGLSVNQIEVKYHNPQTDQDRTVKMSNQAAIIAARGVINSTSVSYTGIPVPSLALRVAQRDLRAASTTLRRFTVTLDRRGYEIEPGSVIAIEDTSRNIPRTAIRVGKVDAGSLTDGKITITGVQDVFHLPTRTFAANVPATWVPPSVRPCIDAQRVFEVPYYLLNQSMSPADFDYINENAGYVALLNAQGKPMNIGAKLAVRPSAPTPDDEPGDTSYMCEV